MLGEFFISEQFYNLHQSWNYVWIGERGGNKLKIRRNAYDIQSYLRGYVFDPIQKNWNLLVDHPIMAAACSVVTYVDRQPDIELFRRDSQGILEEL